METKEKLPEIYEQFGYINQYGKALDDCLNEFRNDNGEVVYVPQNHFKYFDIVEEN